MKFLPRVARLSRGLFFGLAPAPGQLLSQGSPLRSPGKPSAEERNPDLDLEQHTHNPQRGGGDRTLKGFVIWSEWHLKSLTWSRRATMLLLAFELQSLFWFCTEIRAAETAAAAVLVVVLAQCKSAKDSCSLHTLRACCCFTHSHLHRGRHQQGGSGSHDYPSTMGISHR